MRQGELAALRALERWVRQNKGIPQDVQATTLLKVLLAEIDKTRSWASRLPPELR